MTIIEIIKVTKDVVLILGAILGAIFAFWGLGTWRRQLKGQSEYELSRRILVTLFRYRDAVDSARHPVMWAYELPIPPENELKSMSQEQVRFYGRSKAYQNRWEKVQNQRNALYADLLEAEAVWGSDLNELFNKVFKLEHELFMAIRNHLDLMNPEVSE